MYYPHSVQHWVCKPRYIASAFCTATRGKSRYIEVAFCTETRVHSVQNCIAIHACFAWMVKNLFYFSLNSTPFNNIYNAKSPKTHELKLGYRQRKRQLLGVLLAEYQGGVAPAMRGNLLPPLRKILLKKSLFCVKIS